MIAADRWVTYSSAYTLVPTYECFNRCSYCNFRADLGTSPWLALTAADAILRRLQPLGVVEILILSGEVHPKSPARSPWFQRLYDLCNLALDRGFLPHTNAGPLLQQEMAQLRQVNVSMGLMLEQITPRLLATVHRHAPSKRPETRLQQLQWAGELGIPFTTGVLLGLGETAAERVESLEAIAQLHQTYGHIQEVILQPHRLGQQQAFDGKPLAAEDLIALVAIARAILPADICIQVPPNLIDTPEALLACLEAGARDLGGIGPKDEVNPSYPHPQVEALRSHLAAHGWQLEQRLPIYPQYLLWLPQPLQTQVSAHTSKTTSS